MVQGSFNVRYLVGGKPFQEKLVNIPIESRNWQKIIVHVVAHTICNLTFKGNVSRVLRWVLLYINQKLFARPIIASHNILTFLKGQFTINKKQAGAPLYYDMVLYRQYWNRRKMGVSAIWKFATASLSDIISRKSTYTILPVFLLVL